MFAMRRLPPRGVDVSSADDKRRVRSRRLLERIRRDFSIEWPLGEGVERFSLDVFATDFHRVGETAMLWMRFCPRSWVCSKEYPGAESDRLGWTLSHTDLGSWHR